MRSKIISILDKNGSEITLGELMEKLKIISVNDVSGKIDQAKFKEFEKNINFLRDDGLIQGSGWFENPNNSITLTSRCRLTSSGNNFLRQSKLSNKVKFLIWQQLKDFFFKRLKEIASVVGILLLAYLFNLLTF